MKKTMLLLSAIVLVLAVSVVLFAAPQGDAAKGKEVYAKEKCQMCHSIAGTGNPKYPLDGVGSKLNGEQIKKWIKTPKEMNPKVMMKAYPNISDQDLADLAAYMLSLNKK